MLVKIIAFSIVAMLGCPENTPSDPAYYNAPATVTSSAGEKITVILENDNIFEYYDYDTRKPGDHLIITFCDHGTPCLFDDDYVVNVAPDGLLTY